VLVVGAGPVGLTAALALRAHGLPVTVLESEPADRVRPGSRALFVHRRSLTLLNQVHPGLGERIAQHGVVWRTRRTLHRGRQVYTRTFAPVRPGALPPFTSLRQVETEGFLLAACEAAGVHFVWDATVAGVEATSRDVTLTTADGRAWTAGRVIAADGARSAVRHALGIAMDGRRAKGCHVVVDIAGRPGEQLSERIFHYEHPGLGGRTVLQVPFAGGFQVDLQCFDDDEPATYASEDAVARWLPAVVGDGFADRVQWVSTYRFLQVVAATFVEEQRRVLLVGEAAHLFPPFGARGMNSGIADAIAAADAVASDTTSAIDEFAATRRAAAVFNSNAAGTALAMLRPGRVMRARQWAAAVLASSVPRFGSWLEHAPYGPRSSY
jgi:3-(3-hydroxy-phenyl)propionate hydroxylase